MFNPIKARTHSVRAFFVSIVLSTLLAGCAQRLDELNEKITDLQQRTSLVEAKTGGPVGNDRELLEGQKLADVRSQVSTIRNDLTVLAGKIEAMEYETKRLVSRQDQMAQEVEQKLRELSKAKQASEEKSTEAEEGKPTSSGPETDFEAALKAHQDGDFSKSEKLFEGFLAKRPKHSLADKATYWLADGYLNQKMYKKAIAKFQDLVDRFPKSDKRCDAMSKQIQAFKALGMQKEAGVFTQVRDSECK